MVTLYNSSWHSLYWQGAWWLWEHYHCKTADSWNSVVILHHVLRSVIQTRPVHCSQILTPGGNDYRRSLQWWSSWQVPTIRSVQQP